MSNHEENKPHIVDYKTNILVWIDLLIFTLITVRIAFFDLENLTVIVALLVASVKTWLVGSIFMHLKFENRFFKLMVGLTVAVLVLVMILLFSDYLYRLGG